MKDKCWDLACTLNSGVTISADDYSSRHPCCRLSVPQSPAWYPWCGRRCCALPYTHCIDACDVLLVSWAGPGLCISAAPGPAACTMRLDTLVHEPNTVRHVGHLQSSWTAVSASM